MGIIVNLDKDGHLIYDGMLSSKEKASADEVLDALKTEIPQIEKDLQEKYGNGVLYKYYLGFFLGDLLEKYNIIESERRRFWNEIKDLASSETRKRDEGKASVVRSFLEQCYVLSRYDLETVQSLSWKQWQDILDRVRNREDERIFDWIRNYPRKFKQAYWSEFEKALNLYLKDKDTSVFTDDELFEIYDSLLAMSEYWVVACNDFKKKNPNSAKIKTMHRRSKKYQNACFRIKRELREPLDEKIFAQGFEEAMK